MGKLLGLLHIAQVNGDLKWIVAIQKDINELKESYESDLVFPKINCNR